MINAIWKHFYIKKPMVGNIWSLLSEKIINNNKKSTKASKWYSQTIQDHYMIEKTNKDSFTVVLYKNQFMDFLLYAIYSMNK